MSLCLLAYKIKRVVLWLKVSDKCETRGLDYRFAALDDSPAFFSLCIVVFPVAFFVV